MEFEALAQTLLGQIKFILPSWLPGGRFAGNEYKCASLRGGKGDSLSINITTGAWADFAVANVKGGDLIALYAAIENLRQSEAFRILSERYEPSLVGNTPKQRKAEIVPVAAPTEASVPEMIHPQYGPPSAYWRYKDQVGNTLFYVARYNNPKCPKCGIGVDKVCTSCGAKAAKELLPWCWVDKHKAFKAVGWPAPRPIYGLEQLGDLPIMIVEGEKTCEAARKIVAGNYTVVTWPNGTNAIKKVDWSPLSGRPVVLWPDADEVGVKAAYDIARQLQVVCSEIKIITPEGQANGWDAADALEEGWDYDKFIEWAKPRVKKAFPVDAELVKEDEGQAAQLPLSVYGMWEKFGIAQNGNGQPVCNVDNALRVFEGSPDFVDFIWYDEFHKKYYTKWGTGIVREWCDIDELNMAAFFQRDLGMSRMTDDYIHKAAMVVAHRYKRNEPLDWMRGLKWDGNKRIDGFFSEYFGAEVGYYTQAASKNFWISMVARIFNPGVKVDNMVILEGHQGKFKSTALAVIGGAWYAESHETIGTPNFFQGLMGKMVVEISELDSFSKAETNTIKRVVSCPIDRLRLPYARSTQDYPRQCVFVGTTNEDAYLRDSTGARRFWPIKTGRIKISEIKEDREQLFAEAVTRLLAGETWYEMPEDAWLVQESRRQADEWEPLVQTWLEQTVNGELGYTIAEICKGALDVRVDKLDTITQRRVGKILRVLGYQNRVVSRLGISSRVWSPPLFDRRSGLSVGYQAPETLRPQVSSPE